MKMQRMMLLIMKVKRVILEDLGPYLGRLRLKLKSIMKVEQLNTLS